MIFKFFSQLSVDGPGKIVKISQFRQFCPLVNLIASMISMKRTEILNIAINFRSSQNFGGEECTVPFVTYQQLVTQFQTNLGKQQQH